MDRVRVDLGQLAAITTRMERFDRVLEWVLEDANRQVERLHRTWTGDAATTHREAHRTWEQGAADLRAGLAEIRAVASTAHANYQSAVEANVAMWRQVR
jgi:WXG100 family type VII secretion target